MSYNFAEHANGWRFNGLHDGEEMADYLQPFSCGLSMRPSNGRTNTHTHILIRTLTPMNAIGENTTCCISL